MPFGVDGRMIIARPENTRDLLAAYAFTAGGTAFESAVAARKIWARAGFEIDSYPLETAWRELSENTEKPLVSILSGFHPDAQDRPCDATRSGQ